MPELKGFQKTYLRGLAHERKPIVMIGKEGLVPGVVESVKDGLARHELVKVRFVSFKEKEQKEALAARLLEETGGLVDTCAGPACATLLRARGRALLQIGEREAAQRALEAALAVAPGDPSGHTLASEILVDLTLLRTSRPGGKSD